MKEEGISITHLTCFNWALRDAGIGQDIWDYQDMEDGE